MAVLCVSRVGFLLFFILVCFFLLLNLLLTVLYNSYAASIEYLVIEKLYTRRKISERCLRCFFCHSGTSQISDGWLIFNQLRNNRKHSYKEKERIELVLAALDDVSDKSASLEEFLDVFHVLKINFIVDLKEGLLIERLFQSERVYGSGKWY